MLDITWNRYVRNVNKTGVQQFFNLCQKRRWKYMGTVVRIKLEICRDSCAMGQQKWAAQSLILTNETILTITEKKEDF